MFAGEPCIDTYNKLYAGTYAEQFDPFTSEQTNEVMCTQLVDLIETLISQNNTDQIDSLRYSYMLSQNSDLQVAQTNDFGKCVESEAETDPKALCISTITEYGQFALFSNQMKADVCAQTINKYKTVRDRAIAKQQDPVSSCSFIIVQVYSDYAQFLNDLLDDIVDELYAQMKKTKPVPKEQKASTAAEDTYQKQLQN